MSRRIAYITDPSKMEDIDEVIHDCFFDPDDIFFDTTTSVLNIKFRREAFDKSRLLKRGWFLKKWQVPVIECFLKFYSVKRYEIEDTEQVGRYNFNDLGYDPQQKRIIVNTGVTIHIEIIVGTLEVEVEETDTIVEEKTFRTLFDIREL